MSVTLRPFELSDVKPIDRIFRKKRALGVPSLKNVITNATLINEKEVIGYGVVKAYAEAVLILDPEIRKRDKAKAVMNGVNFAIESCKAAGVEQLFIFSNTDGFTKVLERKFGFRKASGVTLFLELGEESKES